MKQKHRMSRDEAGNVTYQILRQTPFGMCWCGECIPKERAALARLGYWRVLRREMSKAIDYKVAARAKGEV